MADGIPAGFEIEQSQAPAPSTTSISPEIPTPSVPEGFEVEGNQHETLGSQIGAGLEGAASGLLGPLAPMIEQRLGVQPEDIQARKEANPYTHGAGEAIGFIGGALTGTGEAKLMEKAGEAATKAVGLAEPVSLAAKVGSSTVKNAVEMAVMSGGDEVSKQILNDPHTSAESAIANIGLASALGGGAGAFMTGAVSPLWKATVGPKLESFLTGMNKSLNGDAHILPEVVQKAVTDLGIEPHPVMKAILSGDAKAIEHGQYLYRSNNPEFMGYVNQLRDQAAKSVSESLGVPLDDVAVFSNKDSGDAIHEFFTKQVDKEYGPLAKALNKRDAESATIAIPDDERLNFASKIMERAVQEGTDSPYYPIYEHYAQRVMSKENIGGYDKLRTELFGKNSLDKNEKRTWNNIRQMIGDFQENYITKEAKTLGEEGKQLGSELLNERAETSRNYNEYAKKLDKLTDFLGIDDFRGTGTLKEKMAGITSEDLLKKFSIKGDVEGAEFLKKEFPQIAELVRQHEAKKFLSKSIYPHLGETFIDPKKLNASLAELFKGTPEYPKEILGDKAINSIQSSKVINDAISQITNIKDSGTPAGMAKLFGMLGASVTGAVGWLAGHNVVASALVGHLAKLLSVDAPQAIKLAALKHMASEAPIKAEGFKAAVDYIQHNIKAAKSINNAVEGVFKTNAKPNIYIPSHNDIMKLDKLVAKNEKNPEEQANRIANGQTGHYMPEHQAVLAQTSTAALNYLQSIKPKPTIIGPLDKPIAPTQAEQARYERALTIAENPMIVMKHIKDGTLQVNDIKDLGSMYPSLYQQFTAKLTDQIATAKDSEEPIPYNTRIGLSLFMAQPLDSTMTPANIIAAQPKPKQAPPQQGQPKPKPSKMSPKASNSYKTPSQEAESDRSNRD